MSDRRYVSTCFYMKWVLTKGNSKKTTLTLDINSRYIFAFFDQWTAILISFWYFHYFRFLQDLDSHKFSSYSMKGFFIFFNLISNFFKECFSAHKTGRALDVIIKKYQTLLEQNISENFSMKTYNGLSSQSYSFLHEKVED